jgi:hypothetical protein
MRRPIREIRVRPSNILRWMRKQDAARYGNGGLPPEEAIKKSTYRTEIEEHKMFLDWCKLNGIPRVYSRLDRRSTIDVGWPDFSVFHGGLTIFFDFKVTTKLSRDQEITIGVLREVGFEVFLVNTAAEAISIAREVFGL